MIEGEGWRVDGSGRAGDGRKRPMGRDEQQLTMLKH